MLVDTHVHLDSFTDVEVGEILRRGSENGVGFVVSAGTTISKTKRSIELSNRHSNFFSGAGVHPMDIRAPLISDDYDQLESLASSSEKVLVMSEIGLDFMENMPDRAWQFDAFRKQIGIARELGLPIVFHSREAHEDCFRVLREEKAYEVGGVMHYFQGTSEDAKQAIDMGFFISIARPIFRLPHLQEIVANTSLEHIVLETDSAPQPFKKKRDNWTEPRHLLTIAKKIAELHSTETKSVVDIIFRNTRRLLHERWETVRQFVPNA